MPSCKQTSMNNIVKSSASSHCRSQSKLRRPISAMLQPSDTCAQAMVGTSMVLHTMGLNVRQACLHSTLTAYSSSSHFQLERCTGHMWSMLQDIDCPCCFICTDWSRRAYTYASVMSTTCFSLHSICMADSLSLGALTCVHDQPENGKVVHEMHKWPLFAFYCQHSTCKTNITNIITVM